MTVRHNSLLKCRGFTLVELLVALTIIALISGLLTSSMGFSLKTAERVEARILGNESLHAAQRAFRRQVQLARPVVIESENEDARLAFAASASQLDFVAPLPGLTLGGLLHQISLRFDDDTGQLLMEFVPYLDDSRDGEDAFAVNHVVLIDGLESAEFSYLDTLGVANGTWLPEWRDAGRLPDLVRLSLSFDEQADESGVEFIVAIKATLPMRTGDT